MLFTIYDIKPSHHVHLKYNKDEFVVLKNGRLANLSNGDCSLKIIEQYEEVKKVFNNQHEILAVLIGERLQKYDVTQHDKQIVKIKRQNKLLSYDELVVELMRQKINHSNLLMVDYHKVNGSYKTDTGNITCPTYRGQAMKAKQLINEEVHKINLEITKYLINKKENLFLYRYTTSFQLY